MHRFHLEYNTLHHRVVPHQWLDRQLFLSPELVQSETIALKLEQQQEQNHHGRRVRFARSAMTLEQPDEHQEEDQEEEEEEAVAAPLPATAAAAAVATSDVWYSKQDFQRIVTDYRFEIQQLRRLQQPTTTTLRVALGRRCTLSSTADICLRGLEDVASSRAKMARKARIQAVVRNVLEEQARQQQLGVNYPNRIRNKSRIASQESRQLAFDLAQKDCREREERQEQEEKEEMELQKGDQWTTSSSLFLQECPPSGRPSLFGSSIRVDRERKTIILDDTIHQAICIAQEATQSLAMKAS